MTRTGFHELSRMISPRSETRTYPRRGNSRRYSADHSDRPCSIAALKLPRIFKRSFGWTEFSHALKLVCEVKIKRVPFAGSPEAEGKSHSQIMSLEIARRARVSTVSFHSRFRRCRISS